MTMGPMAIWQYWARRIFSGHSSIVWSNYFCFVCSSNIMECMSVCMCAADGPQITLFIYHWANIAISQSWDAAKDSQIFWPKEWDCCTIYDEFIRDLFKSIQKVIRISTPLYWIRKLIILVRLTHCFPSPRRYTPASKTRWRISSTTRA